MIDNRYVLVFFLFLSIQESVIKLHPHQIVTELSKDYRNGIYIDGDRSTNRTTGIDQTAVEKKK